MTRGQLIAAAGRVFRRRGYANASVTEIAAEAGFTTGALYWHFESKDQLFLAVYEERAAQRAREVLDALHDAGPATQERAGAAADQWMERVREDPDGFALSLEFALHARGRPELAAAFADRLSAVRETVARELERAASERGIELPMPAPRLAMAIRALGIGLAFERLSDPERVPEDVFAEFMTTFFQLLERQQVAS